MHPGRGPDCHRATGPRRLRALGAQTLEIELRERANEGDGDLVGDAPRRHRPDHMAAHGSRMQGICREIGETEIHPRAGRNRDVDVTPHAAPGNVGDDSACQQEGRMFAADLDAKLQRQAFKRIAWIAASILPVMHRAVLFVPATVGGGWSQVLERRL